MWYSTSVRDLIYLHVVATLFKTSPLWSSKFDIFCDKYIQMNGNSSNMKLFLILFALINYYEYFTEKSDKHCHIQEHAIQYQRRFNLFVRIQHNKNITQQD